MVMFKNRNSKKIISCSNIEFKNLVIFNRVKGKWVNEVTKTVQHLQEM